MPADYRVEERRKFKRLVIRLAVLYQVNKPLFIRMQIGDKEVLATTIDLCEGGLSVSTDYNIKAGSELILTLTLYRVNATNKVESYGPIRLTGEVRSCLPLHEQNRYRLGICFTSVTNEDNTAISRFIKLLLNK